MPILLILLDFWPLKRLARRTILEKIPLLAIGAVAAVIVFISQQTTSYVKLPGESGLLRILLLFSHNIIFYLKEILWPVGRLYSNSITGVDTKFEKGLG